MNDYQMFPKMMKHPGYVPAVNYRQPRFRPGEEGWGNPIDPGQTGKPAKFPDVSVNNADQEMQYAALGYTPSGVADPEAYRRAMTNNEERPANTVSEYPKILYKLSDKIEGDLQYETANNRSDEDRLIGKGWYLKPDDAREETDRPDEEEVEASEPEPKKKKGKRAMSEETKRKISETVARKKAEKAQQAQA